jgi:hypothetical protein
MAKGMMQGVPGEEPIESPQGTPLGPQGNLQDPKVDSQGEKKKIDPKVEREVQAYIMGLSKMLHSKKTQPKVVQMLKSGGEPEQLVPKIALLINDQMESALSQKGQKPSLDILLGAAQFLVGDLLEMGNALGVFQVETEEQVAPILQNTMQTYIEKGLKDGSIDPVELQQKVEPLMPPEMREKAIGIAQQQGIPMEPDQMVAMEAYAQKRMQKGGRR